MGQSRQSKASKAAPSSHVSSTTRTTSSTIATTASSLPQNQQAFAAGPSHALDSDLAAASMLPFPRFPGSALPQQPPSYSLNAFDQQQSHNSAQLDPLVGTSWALPPATDASGVHALDSPDNTSRDILDLFRKFIDLPSEDESDDPDFRPQEDREEDEWVAESDTASGDEEIVFNQSQDEGQDPTQQQQQPSTGPGHVQGQGMPHASFHIDSLLALPSSLQPQQTPQDPSVTVLANVPAAPRVVPTTQQSNTSTLQAPQASPTTSARPFQDQADGHEADHEDNHNQAADASVEMPPPPPPPPKRRGRPRKVLTAEQEREANAAKAAKVPRNKIAPEDRKEAKLERNRASNKRRRTQAQMNTDKMQELEAENASLRARVVNLEDYIYSMAMGPAGGDATARSAHAAGTNATANNGTSVASIAPNNTPTPRASS